MTKNRIGVCSWSLQASTPEELADRIVECGPHAVQLALDPLRPSAPDPWNLADTTRALDANGIACVSGMMGMVGEDYSSLESIRRTGGVRPDEHWNANRAAATENARIARQLGLDLVTFHAGFLPAEAGEERAELIRRLREIVDRFADEGVRAAFETGQENAVTLLAFLEELDRPNAGVNFDPANMILYDEGDPIDALRRLAPWVRQMHVKDATRTRTPGEWGAEVAVGSGEVDWPAFFSIVREFPLNGDLVIEREAGETRVEDIRTACALVGNLLGRDS